VVALDEWGVADLQHGFVAYTRVTPVKLVYTASEQPERHAHPSTHAKQNGFVVAMHGSSYSPHTKAPMTHTLR